MIVTPIITTGSVVSQPNAINTFDGYLYTTTEPAVISRKVMKLVKPIVVSLNYVTKLYRPAEFGYARIPAALIARSDITGASGTTGTTVESYIKYKHDTVARHGIYRIVITDIPGLRSIEAIYNNGLPTKATFYYDQELILTIDYNQYGLPTIYTTNVLQEIKNNVIQLPIERWTTDKLSAVDIDIRRRLVAEELSIKYPATIGVFTLQAAMLEQLFTLYDKYFFGNTLKPWFNALNTTGSSNKTNNITVSFAISNKMTSTAGSCKTLTHQCSYVITLSTLFDNLFKIPADAKSQQPITLDANGIICNSQIMCVQVVFEHELLHLLIDTMAPTDNKIVKQRTAGGVVSKEVRDIHGNRFKLLANNIFGHTKTKHGLLSGDVESYQKKVDERLLARETKRQEMKAVLSKGMVVTITEPKGEKWQGTVIGNIKSNSVRVAIEPLDKTKRKVLIPLGWITA